MKVKQKAPCVTREKSHLQQSLKQSAASWQSEKFFHNVAALRRAVHVTTATLWMEKNATSATAGSAHVKLMPDGKTGKLLCFSFLFMQRKNFYSKYLKCDNSNRASHQTVKRDQTVGVFFFHGLSQKAGKKCKHPTMIRLEAHFYPPFYILILRFNRPSV